MQLKVKRLGSANMRNFPDRFFLAIYIEDQLAPVVDKSFFATHFSG